MPNKNVEMKTPGAVKAAYYWIIFLNCQRWPALTPGPVTLRRKVQWLKVKPFKLG